MPGRAPEIVKDSPISFTVSEPMVDPECVKNIGGIVII